MTISHIVLLGSAGIVIRVFASDIWRIRLLALLSILVIFILQPVSPIRNLDFWLPCLTLAVTGIIWAACLAPSPSLLKHNRDSFGLVFGTLLGIAALRYTELDRILLPSAPPPIEGVLMVLTGLALSILLVLSTRSKIGWAGVCTALIVLGFILIKSPPIAAQTSAILRQWNGQAVDLANSLDIRWLGYSYLAFRLLHVLRDRQSGRTLNCTFLEFLVYVLFFPSFTAGPIDRCERFLKDLRKPNVEKFTDVSEGIRRLLVGMFKKFVLADSLALISLNQINIPQIYSTGWMWVLMMSYSLQIFLDFSGYTDIAIGLGRLAGVQLPENFNKPYLQSNLTTFWNNWHMTLTQWFRSYFFNPLTRTLRSRKNPVSQNIVILIGQVSTMLLIGMWHGITINFIVWGLWHGLGLFIQNQYSSLVRTWFVPRFPKVFQNSFVKIIINAAGIALTFIYVSIGWLWFAVSDPAVSWLAFQRLFGGGW